MFLVTLADEKFVVPICCAMGFAHVLRLIFERRVRKDLPGRFRTRVLTDGVIPSLHLDCKSTKIKQRLIERVPKSHRYRVTDHGWRTILFCTRCHNGLLRPGLAA